MLIAFSFLCAGAYAQKQAESCPWLNAATAGGVLGGEARMLVSHTPADRTDQINGAPGDATCEFKLMNGTDSLKIAVHTMHAHAKDFPEYVATCGSSPRKLVGVGNEAVACTLPNSATRVTDKVVARIRERVFVLSWYRPANAAGPASAPAEEASSKDVVRDKLQNTAEQIAGSLF